MAGLRVGRTIGKPFDLAAATRTRGFADAAVSGILPVDWLWNFPNG